MARILLTNASLAGRSGTETVTRDLALGLKGQGHHLAVYTRRMGAIAQELRAAGVAVVDKVEALAGGFDVIHGHHLAICAGALARHPDTPAIAVSHDGTAWHDLPIFAPNIHAYVGISRMIVDRLVSCGAPPERAHLITNGIDMARFRPGADAPAAPRRALAFAKNAEHVAGVRAACARRGVEVEFVGAGVGNLIDAPEAVLPRYDLVFASAQSAQEALACARPVIVVDGRGLAGMIDMARYEAWRPHNFGLATLTRAPTADAILAEMDRYDAAEAAAVGARARRDLSLAHTLAAYEALYRQAIGAPRVSGAEAARAWERHLEAWAPRMTGEWPWIEEHARLLAALERGAAGMEIAPLDTPLRFDASATAAPFAALSGFAKREAWGAWSRAPSASVRLRPPPASQGLALEMNYALHAPAHGAAMDVTALANGEPLMRWRETCRAEWTPLRQRLALPAALCTGAMAWLTFIVSAGGEAGQPMRAHPGIGLNALTLRAL